MRIDRRKVLAGLGVTGALVGRSAWAQFSGAIKPQSDPYAQVDPYDDPRNGFPTNKPAKTPSASPSRQEGGTFAFSGNAPPLPGSYPLEAMQIEAGEANLPGGVAKFGGLYQNQTVQKAIADFAAPFLKASVRPGLNWQVGVVRAPGINACAMMGGKLLFNPDLIAVCDDPAELGAVVAHEVGHVDYDHAGKRVILAGMLEDAMAVQSRIIPPKIVEAAYGGSGGDALMLGWGLQNEFEADAHIHTIFAKLGMDHTKASLFFHKLLKVEPPERETSLFSTHPGTRERIRRLDDAVNYYPSTTRNFTPPGWTALKAVFPTPPQFRNG